MIFLLGYCRAGAEEDLRNELTIKAKMLGHELQPVHKKCKGLVIFKEGERDLLRLQDRLQLRDVIFARQLIYAAGELVTFTTEDRAGPLVAALDKVVDRLLPRMLYSDLMIETTDTNEGKQLSPFCKKFATPLTNRLKKAGYKRVYSSKNEPRIHVLFWDYDNALVGVSFPGNSSSWPMGIIRLKFPAGAPSRSTLKLEEAFYQFMTDEERALYLREGMVAVDLGAAPGGWTYQFVRRKIKVLAVDNGKLSDELMRSPLVRHHRTDAYKFEPDGPVDWMVCDMVDRPGQVAELIGRWLYDGWSRAIIANLKLPMKNRYDAVVTCLAVIKKEAGPIAKDYDILVKQLYHDRDEVTLMCKHKEGIDHY